MLEFPQFFRISFSRNARKTCKLVFDRFNGSGSLKGAATGVFQFPGALGKGQQASSIYILRSEHARIYVGMLLYYVHEGESLLVRAASWQLASRESSCSRGCYRLRCTPGESHPTLSLLHPKP